MNTASRMESNGLAGKIHVSQATADELVKHGKSHWVTARPDKVIAKGKGELQTYWVSVRGKAVQSSTTTSISSRVTDPADARQEEHDTPPMSPLG